MLSVGQWQVYNTRYCMSCILKGFFCNIRKTSTESILLQSVWVDNCLRINFLLQVHNVTFSFELMQDAGLPKPKARAEGMYIVHVYEGVFFSILEKNII